MQDEALGVHAAGVVVHLPGLVGGGEGGDGEGLRFATGEEGGAVGARQRGDFAGELAEQIDTASIATALLAEDGDAEGFFLDVVEGLADLEAGGGGEGGLDGGFDFVLETTDGFCR